MELERRTRTSLGEESIAYRPWRDWGQSHGAANLIHSAILAASAHNTQPWKFDLSDGCITICVDPERHIGSFDPWRREMHLSIGCALENIDLAARSEGLKTHIELPPGTLSPTALPVDPAAIVRLGPGVRDETELFRAIPRRHTHRGAYEPQREIPGQVLASMRAAVEDSSQFRLFLFTGAQKDRLAELIVAATRAIVADTQMSEDNAQWFRFDRAAIEKTRDGLTLDTNVTNPVANFAAKLFPPSAASADRHWLRDTEKIHVGTAALLGMIAVRRLYDRPSVLSAGRRWQRLHLLLTASGIAAQPLNQPVERVDREQQTNGRSPTADALAQITGDPAWRPTFIFRAGYARRPARASPRRAMDAVIN